MRTPRAATRMRKEPTPEPRRPRARRRRGGAPSPPCRSCTPGDLRLRTPSSQGASRDGRLDTADWGCRYGRRVVDTKQTKTIGEHHVAAELARRGWAPALTRDG